MTEQDDMCLRYAKCYHRVGSLYMQGQRGHTVYDNTKNLKSRKLTSLLTTYHSSSSAFMTSNTPGGAKKHCQNTEPYLSLCNYGKRCLQGGCILSCSILAVVPTFCCSAIPTACYIFFYCGVMAHRVGIVCMSKKLPILQSLLRCTLQSVLISSPESNILTLLCNMCSQE